MLGAYEDVEPQNEFDLLQIVEDLLGGYWEKPLSKWEGRRDGVLDLIGKATPGHFSRAFKSMGLVPSCLLKRSAGAEHRLKIMRERYVPTGTVRLQIVSFNRLNGCLGSLKDAQYNAWTHDTPYSQQTAPQAIESAEYRSVG